ncbi:hypothetical protein BGZ67_003963 [Mortierella alpina]|nr:hypothetical protein BGZ67_003963 [Mortierella alpina]
MIPDGVHKPPRSKILNRKPIPRLNPHNAQPLARANLSSRSTSSSSLSHSEDENQNSQEGLQSPSSTETGQSATVTEVLTKKKHGPSASATVRSQALSEGYDLNEYRPWRDVHLRSMIKTVPAHMSFLLSIRHPGQVSIELLNALYGPQFMQSSAFRAIEQLLWGRKQPQRIEHHPQPQHQYSPHSFSHQYQDSQYHDHHHNGQADSIEPCTPKRSYHHYPQGQGDLMEDDECAFEEAFDEPAYQDPMLGLDHTVGDDNKTFESDHTADDRKFHGHSSLRKAFYAPQDDEDEDVEELAVLSPRMDVVSAGQHFD